VIIVTIMIIVPRFEKVFGFKHSRTKCFIFAKLSFILGTNIPAYTAIMTGTPSGVGVFMKPRRFLQHDEVVEVEIDGIGVLRNRILFPDGQESTM
jgi:hypothetical protein